MTLSTAIAEIKTALANDAAFANANVIFPSRPEEQVNADLFCVVYPPSGAWGVIDQEGDVVGVHTVWIELHTPRKDLGRAYATLLPFLDDVPRIVFAAFRLGFAPAGEIGLGDAEQRGQKPLKFSLGPGNWGGIETALIRFALDVTLR
jgi:hypothetical protein